MKVKEESEKVDLKFNIQKVKIMASGPITSWEIDGETVETETGFIFLGFKITADRDTKGRVWGPTVLSLRGGGAVYRQHLYLLASMYDDTRGILPTREAPRSLDVQGQEGMAWRGKIYSKQM